MLNIEFEKLAKKITDDYQEQYQNDITNFEEERKKYYSKNYAKYQGYGSLIAAAAFMLIGVCKINWFIIIIFAIALASWCWYKSIKEDLDFCYSLKILIRNSLFKFINKNYNIFSLNNLTIDESIEELYKRIFLGENDKIKFAELFEGAYRHTYFKIATCKIKKEIEKQVFEEFHRTIIEIKIQCDRKEITEFIKNINKKHKRILKWNSKKNTIYLTLKYNDDFETFNASAIDFRKYIKDTTNNILFAGMFIENIKEKINENSNIEQIEKNIETHTTIKIENNDKVETVQEKEIVKQASNDTIDISDITEM